MGQRLDAAARLARRYVDVEAVVLQDQHGSLGDLGVPM